MNDQYNRDIENLNTGFASIGQALRVKRQRDQQLKQQAMENQLRQAVFEMNKRQSDAGLANSERDFGYKKERDAVGDERYADQTDYRRGRDQVGDERYEDQTDYRRERDQMGDARYDDAKERQTERDFTGDNFKKMELGLHMNQLKQRGNVGGYITEELDDEGNVVSTKRRTPMRTGSRESGGGGADTVEVTANDGGQKYTYHFPREQFQQFQQQAGSRGVTGKGKDGAGSTDAGGEKIPTLTPAQAAGAKPGTKYRTTDGRLFVR